MRSLLFITFIILNFALFAQVTLVREGEIINNTETGDWMGVNIPRDVPTQLTFRNNTITSINSGGYMLQAGDEVPAPSNNNLDGEVVTGNLFNWQGTFATDIITHGLFAGYNINSIVKFNYLNHIPYGIIFKSGTDDGQNMTFTSGGCAYNIIRNGKFAGRVKGINGIKFYNNTFYNDDGQGWYFLLITSNGDRQIPAPSIGTKVFNNIFYSTIQFPMIKIESGSLTDFECDYNLYWCTAGEPVFSIDDEIVTWSEWRELGYDAHSVILNPDFINSTDLVPRTRLDYGIALGTEWSEGLSITALWNAGSSPTTTNQSDLWQVGARILGSSTENIFYIYPNPSDGHFTLVLSDTSLGDSSMMYVYNISGQMVYNGVLRKEEVIKTLDFSYLDSGYYFLAIVADNGKTFSTTFIKM